MGRTSRVGFHSQGRRPFPPATCACLIIARRTKVCLVHGFPPARSPVRCSRKGVPGGRNGWLGVWTGYHGSRGLKECLVSWSCQPRELHKFVDATGQVDATLDSPSCSRQQLMATGRFHSIAPESGELVDAGSSWAPGPFRRTGLAAWLRLVPHRGRLSPGTAGNRGARKPCRTRFAGSANDGDGGPGGGG